MPLKTGVFPLFEVENGELTLTYGFEELKPVSDYFKIQGRFRHLTEADIATIQERVHKEFEELKARAVKVEKTKI